MEKRNSSLFSKDFLPLKDITDDRTFKAADRIRPSFPPPNDLMHFQRPRRLADISSYYVLFFSLVQKKRWSFDILNPLFSVRSPIVIRIFLDFLASNHPDFRRFLTWNPVYLIPCVSSALFSFFYWLSTSFSSFSK